MTPVSAYSHGNADDHKPGGGATARRSEAAPTLIFKASLKPKPHLYVGAAFFGTGRKPASMYKRSTPKSSRPAPSRNPPQQVRGCAPPSMTTNPKGLLSGPSGERSIIPVIRSFDDSDVINGSDRSQQAEQRKRRSALEDEDVQSRR